MEGKYIKILITGGHHTSALPIIAELSKKNNVSIVWVGHKHTLKGDLNDTLEYKDITALGIPFINLTAGKFYKTYNIFSLLKIPLGFIHALIILIRNRPDVVLSFGGYLAVPVVIVSSFLGIPSYTHEQTVVSGYANKLISKFVKKIFISFDGSIKYYPERKIVYSGIPLRNEIELVQTNNFTFDNNLPVIYITAGKTGSHKINEAVGEKLSELLNIANVIHQTGDYSKHDDYQNLNNIYKRIKDSVTGKYYTRKFVFSDEIGEVYKKADLVVSRAGAHTSSELVVLEKPSLLIPIPWVSHNEQYENAMYVKKTGLGEILEEKELTSDTLISKISHMLNNINSYKINPLAKPKRLDSAKIIIDEIFKDIQK